MATLKIIRHYNRYYTLLHTKTLVSLNYVLFIQKLRTANCNCTYNTRQKSFHSVPSRHHSNGVNMTVGLPSRNRRSSKHRTLAHFCNGGVSCIISTLVCVYIKHGKLCACLREEKTGISAGRGTMSNAA